ncbi:MAG: helix-turn-helix transcriptional regulator [Flavobacteriales bacterium]|nr:helix-turn-helix transcriptional regulator [Flavobacteriales bacterium]
MEKSPTNASILQAFKALSNPARVQMLEFLLEKREANCNDFVQYIGMAQSTVSEHLFEMKKCELFHRNEKGKQSIYTINELQLLELKIFIEKWIHLSEQVHKQGKIKKRKSSKNLKDFNYKFEKKKKNKEQ